MLRKILGYAVLAVLVLLAVKVAFAEPTPLKLGATVDLRISRAAR